MDKREYFQLGNLKLPVMGGLYAFDGNKGHDYVEYAIASGKPLVKPVGEQLRTISFSVMLRSFLGDDIPGIIDQIDKMIEGGDAHDLIFINGYYKGKYYLKTMSDSLGKTLPTGEILEIDLVINLVEFEDRTVLNEYTQSLSARQFKRTYVLDQPKVELKVKEALVNAEMNPPAIKADKANVANRLGSAMTSLNKSASEIATIVGESESKVKNYITGKYSVPVDRAIKLAQNLGVNVDWLYTGAGTMMGGMSLTNDKIRELRENYLTKLVP